MPPKTQNLFSTLKWHSTGLQVHVVDIPETRDRVQILLDPLRLPRMVKPHARVTAESG